MKKLYIWGEQIPYNNGRSKLDDMEIHEEYTMEDIFMKHPGVFDTANDEIDDMTGNDTLAYRTEIEHGLAKDTYTDEPFLIPYIVEGSDRCVISCPGGAYLSKSMDTEGEDIAEFLNAAGISCFVLWYRSYPYRAPIMFRDCQRAIRYVRYHAKEYGICEDKIGLIGFSAGGNLAGTTVEIFRDTPVEEDGYQPDEVDLVSAKVNALGLIYPALSFEKSKALLACVEGKECLKDVEKRERLAECYTLKNHVRNGDPATFLCGARDDNLIPPEQLSEYAEVLRQAGVPCEMHQFPYGGHGFGGCNEKRPSMFPVDYSRVKVWKELFVGWLNSVFM